jgi:hypothetical protein
VGLVAAGAGVARADFPTDVPDRFKIQVGGVASQFVTQGSLAVTDGPAGIFVNFEDVFDLAVSKTAASLEGFWRLGDRSYLDFGYVDYERTSANVVEQDVQWGEVTFLANARVEAEFSSAFPYVAYRRDFLQLDQVRISGSAGITYLSLKASLAADGGVLDENGDPITGHVDEGVDVSFPVPLFGFQTDWKVTRRTAMQFYLRLLYVDIADFRGGINQAALRYEWYPQKHFAIGGGLSQYRLNLRKYETGDYTARFEYNVFGPELYLKLAF